MAGGEVRGQVASGVNIWRVSFYVLKKRKVIVTCPIKIARRTRAVSAKAGPK